MPAPEPRPATSADLAAVLAFWQVAAEDARRPADSVRAVEALVARDPEALILAVDRAWRAGGYAPQGEWSRWVKPL